MDLGSMVQKLGFLVGGWSAACFFVRMGARFPFEKILRALGVLGFVSALGLLLVQLFHWEVESRPFMFDASGSLLVIAVLFFAGLLGVLWETRFMWAAVPLGLLVSGLLILSSKLPLKHVGWKHGLYAFPEWGWGAQLSSLLFWMAVVCFSVSGVLGWIQLVRERVPQEWYRRGIVLFNIVVLVLASVDRALKVEETLPFWDRFGLLISVGAAILVCMSWGLTLFLRGPKLRATLRTESALFAGMLLMEGVWVFMHVRQQTYPLEFLRVFSVFMVSLGISVLSRMQYRFSAELPPREVIEAEAYRWFRRGVYALTVALIGFLSWAWLTTGQFWLSHFWGVGPLLLFLYMMGYLHFRASHPFSDYKLGVVVSLGLIVIWIAGGEFWTLSTSIP